jgi:transposase
LKISGKKINHWYKNFLSEFSSEKEEKKKFPEKDFDTMDYSLKETVYTKEKVEDVEKTLKKNRGKKKEDYKTFYKTIKIKKSQNKKIRVPILKKENFGKRMCIDDKNLGDRGFTILSNLDTGKIACMIETRKSHLITEILSKHVPRKILNNVEILTKDLAYNYESVKRDVFWNAISVADKFHVVKLGIQAISDLRVKYRQKELTKERERIELHKCDEARNRESTR